MGETWTDVLTQISVVFCVCEQFLRVALNKFTDAPL